LSCNSKCKCRHQHGHQGLLNVYLESDELNMQGMVFDFVNLNFVKKFIDDVVDHKMILDIQDPLLPIFYPILSNCIPTDVRSVDYHYEFHREGYFTVRTEQYTGVVREIYDGLVLVPFIPTSENLAKWFYGIVSSKLNNLALTIIHTNL
jgi:6-pyruvoyltetrahydropterin/6-carboxytetrahydropterin synthase